MGTGPGMTMRVGPANKGELYLLANPFVSVRFVGTNDDFLLYKAILANCRNEIPGCSVLQNCHLVWISINHLRAIEVQTRSILGLIIDHFSLLCLSHVLNLIVNNQNQNHLNSAQFFCREVGRIGLPVLALHAAALVSPMINYHNGDHYEDNCDNCEVTSGM